jgi:mono/diheme cytochrome c family protein
MRIRLSLLVAAFVFAAAFVTSTATSGQAQTAPQAPRPGGWTIPPDANTATNPMTGNPQAVAAGKQLYEKNCQRCHGPAGRGDGPDADPDNQQDMDLTQARRGPRNPDGVVFYKVWNGRARPKMPSFKDDLSQDQVWQIVSYVQTLRAKQ